jgi:hypothetical protein
VRKGVEVEGEQYASFFFFKVLAVILVGRAVFLESVTSV